VKIQVLRKQTLQSAEYKVVYAPGVYDVDEVTAEKLECKIIEEEKVIEPVSAPAPESQPSLPFSTPDPDLDPVY
jgi:hypothetical protein